LEGSAAGKAEGEPEGEPKEEPTGESAARSLGDKPFTLGSILRILSETVRI
jgi:hypothetical protein